jgi:hypothetical protein
LSDDAVVIRRGGLSDVGAMTALIESRRRAYEAVEPVFWRKSRNSAVLTRAHFTATLWRRRAVTLVAVRHETLIGFLIATRVRVPPVYAPGGVTMLVDDFCVAEPSLWSTAGRALLDTLSRLGASAGWRQLIVVGAEADAAKSELLRSMDLRIASNWWTKPLRSSESTS